MEIAIKPKDLLTDTFICANKNNYAFKSDIIRYNKNFSNSNKIKPGYFNVSF